MMEPSEEEIGVAAPVHRIVRGVLWGRKHEL